MCQETQKSQEQYHSWKAKLDATGKVSEIKGRVVVNGNQLEYDIWSDRSAPTIRHEHAMFVLKPAMIKKEQITTFDLLKCFDSRWSMLWN